ncbi:MAG TPA: hypothetical protein IAA30_04620 [Candidatus Treponema faecavium]|nr:hypothetical protein [Candidatus Treponema faecavium]
MYSILFDFLLGKGSFFICAVRAAVFLCGSLRGVFCAGQDRTAARWYAFEHMPMAADFPVAKFYFADGKILVCRLSGKKFAVGQRDTCRRQTFHLPTAN